MKSFEELQRIASGCGYTLTKGDDGGYVLMKDGKATFKYSIDTIRVILAGECRRLASLDDETWQKFVALKGITSSSKHTNVSRYFLDLADQLEADNEAEKPKEPTTATVEKWKRKLDEFPENTYPCTRTALLCAIEALERIAALEVKR